MSGKDTSIRSTKKSTAATAAVKENAGLVVDGAGDVQESNYDEVSMFPSMDVACLNELGILVKSIAIFGNYIQHLMCFLYCFMGPIAVLIYEYKYTPEYLIMPIWAMLLSYFIAIQKIGICMSACLHRFFAHNAYQTSRPMSVVLSLIASFGGQRGALWWASKHIRHHKHCDNEKDPHSPQRFSIIYAFTLWTLHPQEIKTDWDFLPKRFLTPELILVDSLAFFFPLLEHYLCYKYLGTLPALISYWSTIGCLNGTLAFNVIFHWLHEGDEEKKFDDGRYQCSANDRIPGMFKTVLGFSGEYAHEDHHVYPQRAKRPTHLIDVPYWAFVKPLQTIGLIWAINDGEGNKKL